VYNLEYISILHNLKYILKSKDIFQVLQFEKLFRFPQPKIVNYGNFRLFQHRMEV